MSTILPPSTNNDIKNDIPYWKLYCNYIDNFETIVIKNIDKIFENETNINNILVNFQKLNLIDHDQLFSQLEFFKANLSYIPNFNISSNTLIIPTTDELINIIKYNCYYLKNYNNLDVADKFIELFGNRLDRLNPIYLDHISRLSLLSNNIHSFSRYRRSTGSQMLSNDVKIGFNAHRIKILENNSITSLETIQKQINTIIKESVINRNEIKELKDQLELYKNKIDSLTDKKESTDINVFTKKIVGKQIVYKDIEEYVYDYSYMKSSREDLHKEIKTVYRIFQRMIQNKYIPEAILVVSTK